MRAKIFGVMLLPLMLSMTACGGGSVRGVDACAPWQPIYVAAEDRLSRDTARQIVGHNEVGERLCGWRPAQR